MLLGFYQFSIQIL